jgi:hypothetical protein
MEHTLQVGCTYSAEIRGRQSGICTNLIYKLENLTLQSSPVDITTIGESYRTYVAIRPRMGLVGDAEASSDLSLKDVAGWLTRILRLFDVDPSRGQHWDSRIVGASPGLSTRIWRVTSQSIPFAAFP